MNNKLTGERAYGQKPYETIKEASKHCGDMVNRSMPKGHTFRGLLRKLKIERKSNMSKSTTEEFSKTYQPFLNACKAAGVEPSKNEASKYRRGIGTAINFSSEKWRVAPHKVTK